MQEKEPKQSFLTWKSAAIVLTSVGAGFVLGSRETRGRIGEEVGLCYRGFRSLVKKGQDRRQAAEFGFKARKILTQVFPEGLKAKR